LPDSGRLCDALPGRSVGVPDRAAYDREVVWCLTPDDPTHYAVRLLRYLPERPAAERFDAAEWRRCAYPHPCPVRSARLALAPGSGRARPSKRWPMAGWRRVAAWALRSGLTPVWFLGPDERELLAEAAAAGGEVVSGPWDEVIAAHAGCPVGLCNDTVHLHIRAHLRVRTLALFRDSRWEHWGAYPERVAGLRVTGAGGPEVEQVLGALRTIISPEEGRGPGAARGSCAPTILLEATSGGGRDEDGWE
jgi:hypothetical protein